MTGRAEGAGDEGDRRARVHPARGVHGRDRHRQPAGGAGPERGDPDLRGGRRLDLAGRRRRGGGRFGPGARADRGVRQGGRPGRGDRWRARAARGGPATPARPARGRSARSMRCDQTRDSACSRRSWSSTAARSDLDRHLARLAASVRVLYGAALAEHVARRREGRRRRVAEAPRARMRVLADPEGTVRINVPRPARPGPRSVSLIPFELPGGLGAHKWRDRRLLEALGVVARGAVPLLLDSDGSVLEAAYANVWIVEASSSSPRRPTGGSCPAPCGAGCSTPSRTPARSPSTCGAWGVPTPCSSTSSISGRHPARLQDGAPLHDPAGLEVRR